MQYAASQRPFAWLTRRSLVQWEFRSGLRLPKEHSPSHSARVIQCACRIAETLGITENGPGI